VVLPPESGSLDNLPVIGLYLSPDLLVWVSVAVDFVWDNGWIISSWVSFREENDLLTVHIAGTADDYASWHYRVVVVR
jgi:hypothetical protein